MVEILLKKCDRVNPSIWEAWNSKVFPVLDLYLYLISLDVNWVTSSS